MSKSLLRSRALPAALLGAIAVLPFAGCKAAPLAKGGELPPAALEQPEPTRLRLAPDDLVRVTVFGYPELSSLETGERVDYEGNLGLPGIGAVKVAGRTVQEARAAIAGAASRIAPDANVSLSVLEYAPRDVFVLGQVKAGGAFDLQQPIPAIQALALAGGFEDGADRKNVTHLRIVDGKLVVHTFDAATPGPDGYRLVQPGDLLFVRQTGSGSFREEVMPYLQAFAPPLQAIASLIIVTDRLKN